MVLPDIVPQEYGILQIELRTRGVRFTLQEPIRASASSHFLSRVDACTTQTLCRLSYAHSKARGRLVAARRVSRVSRVGASFGRWFDSLFLSADVGLVTCCASTRSYGAQETHRNGG